LQSIISLECTFVYIQTFTALSKDLVDEVVSFLSLMVSVRLAESIRLG